MDSVNLETLRQAVAWQAAGLPVTLATVVRTWGSSPRREGRRARRGRGACANLARGRNEAGMMAARQRHDGGKHGERAGDAQDQA